MYQELFKRIVEASQTESLTFFVGAGVSKLSNAPKWSELIDAFSDSLGRDKKSNYSKLLVVSNTLATKVCKAFKI